MVLINGCSEHLIPVTDRGLQYGDGVFETIRITQGRAVALPEHFTRLQLGCERLLIPCPSWTILEQEIQQLILSQSAAVLKIMITRGSGGRGYRPPDPASPTRILSLHPYPDYPEHYKTQGIVARVCHMRLSLNPALAGIKHLNRLEQVLARAEWQDSAIQEGIMLDALDRVIEGTMSNLFMVKSQVLWTAPLMFSGVAGIMRAKVLAGATQLGYTVNEAYFTLDNLLAADEVFVTNAVLGLWPVRQLGQQIYSVGQVTRNIMASVVECA